VVIKTLFISFALTEGIASHSRTATVAALGAAKFFSFG
jgi:hypothetical protein